METYSNCQVWLPTKNLRHHIHILPRKDNFDIEIGQVVTSSPDIINATVQVFSDTRVCVSGLFVTYQWHRKEPFIKSLYSHPEQIPSNWELRWERIDLVFPISNWFKKFLVVYPPESFFEVESINNYEREFLNFEVVIDMIG